MIETHDSSYRLTKIAKENGIFDIKPADISNVELDGEIFVFNLSTVELDGSDDIAIIGGDFSVRIDKSLEYKNEENAYDLLLKLQEIRDKINLDIETLEKFFRLVPV